jgi:DNA-binding NarL/FixJ family response regulator
MDFAPRDDVTEGMRATARVVGGGHAGRRHVIELLRRAGLAPAGAAEPCALAVLLSADGDIQRVQDIRTLISEEPQASLIAVVATETPNASLRKTLLGGVRGIVLSSELERALGPTAQAVLAGQLVVPLRLARQIAPRPLSFREKQILGLAVLGLTNRQIAQRLFLAESTVKTHLSSAFRKIDARSRAEAAARLENPEAGLGIAHLGDLDEATEPAA